MSLLMQTLSRFVSMVESRDVPPQALETARTGILDCVGVMIAGAGEEAVRIVAKTVRSVSDQPAAPEFPSGRMLDPADAALVNGVAAHVLDFDDVGIDGHPSAVLTPAILASASAAQATGKEMLTAYVAGYETWAFLSRLEPAAFYERGFHPTGLLGTVAAAAACARLGRLSEQQTAHAIGIAASMASGLVSNFGTMTKSFHAGRAAQAGVTAARLASFGFTASPDALDHTAGFLRAHSPSGTPDIEAKDAALGKVWQLPLQGLNIKRYPTCYANHRCIDGIIALVQQHDVKADAIARIDAEVGAMQKLILRNNEPKTALAAKFSMEFGLAAAVIAQRVGLPELSAAFVTRPDVVALMRKVHTSVNEAIMPDLPFAPEDTVSITLTSGAVLQHAPIQHAKGSWALPMTSAELAEKFRGCVAPVLGTSHAEALLARLKTLDQARSVFDLPLALDRAAWPVSTRQPRIGTGSTS
jgi:2-methylcitrate dehydratase PrpD